MRGLSDREVCVACVCLPMRICVLDTIKELGWKFLMSYVIDACSVLSHTWIGITSYETKHTSFSFEDRTCFFFDSQRCIDFRFIERTEKHNVYEKYNWTVNWMNNYLNLFLQSSAQHVQGLCLQSRGKHTQTPVTHWQSFWGRAQSFEFVLCAH